MKLLFIFLLVALIIAAVKPLLDVLVSWRLEQQNDTTDASSASTTPIEQGHSEGKHGKVSRLMSKMPPIDVCDYIYTKFYKPQKLQ